MNKNILLLCTSVIILSACAASPKTAQPAGDSMKPEFKTTAIDKAMDKALDQAEASGNTQEALALLSELHNRTPEDPQLAARYAKALREDDQIKKAITVLNPFSSGDKKDVDAITENAMANLELGDYKTAENLASDAIEMKKKNARAYLALGTAQDAQGKHQDAEISFREGIKHWRGNPAPILNNLALNLASQGHLEESLSLIKKAQKEAPNNMELERNKRIISTLLETTGPRPPAPNKKPNQG